MGGKKIALRDIKKFSTFCGERHTGKKRNYVNQSREAERNTKRVQSDETALINDFRTVLSKLNSLEKLDLVRGALKALETENEKYSEANKQEKSDFDEKFKRPASVNHEPVALKPNFDVNSENHIGHDGFTETSSNRESELYKKIEELQEENKRLFANIEELDQQHEESIGNHKPVCVYTLS